MPEPQEHRWPCAQCGSQLRYSPGQTSLTCGHCGHLQAIVSETTWSRAEALRELDLAKGLHDDLSAGDMVDIRTTNCPNCGAQVAITGATHATECPFCATPVVLASLKQRVSDNALELARHGVPKAPLYLTGNVGGTPVVLHAEGDRVIVSKDGARAEVAFDPRPIPPMPQPAAISADPTVPAAAAEAAASAAITAGMPQPATPTAAVTSAWTGAEVPQPGVSALDGDGLRMPDAPTGGAT